MTYDRIVQTQLTGARRRVEEMRRRLAASADGGALAQEVLEELMVALEELQVTEEELRLQNESLASAHLLLEEEHQRYADLFHLAPDPYLVTTPEGAVREANDAAALLFGLDVGTLATKPLAVFVARHETRAFRERLARAAASPRTEDWELTLVRRDGSVVEVSCTVVSSREGGDPVLRWSLRDVSARRAAEEAARRLAAERAARAEAEAARRGMDELLDRLTDAFVIVDDGWRVTRMNRLAETLTRRALGERGPFTGRTLWELFPRAAGTEWERELKRAAAMGAPAVFEAFSPPLAAWLEARAYPGDEGGLSIFLRDVTARRRRETADRLLTRVGEILAGSLDSAATLQGVADAAAGTLADYCIVHVEEGGELRAPGIAHADPTRRELLRGLLRRFPMADPAGPHPAVVAIRTGEARLMPEVPRALLEAISTEPEHLEMLEALGLKSAIVVPMKARGRTMGAISLGRTRGAPYDAADLEVAGELARRAALALDNARAYEAARAATAAREEVLAVVSHDLRNPLNAVTMCASLLEDGADERGWRQQEVRLVRTLLSAAGQMERLVQDLVEVQALESGARELRTEAVEAKVLVEGAAELFHAQAAGGAVRLGCEVAPGLPPVRADRARVLQLLSNLLGNALKHTPRGGAVTLSAAADGEGAVRLTVRDTGPGIAPDDLPHVFDRFWQARRGAAGGLGLGLAIARAIAEAHGGRIWAESREGEGSAFHFTLPAAAGPPAAEAEAA